MRQCERCGRRFYYDSCPYCALTSERESGRKNRAPGGGAYFWILIIIIGFVAAIMDPPSVIPVAGMAALVWGVSRLGARIQSKKRRRP